MRRSSRKRSGSMMYPSGKLTYLVMIFDRFIILLDSYLLSDDGTTGAVTTGAATTGAATTGDGPAGRGLQPRTRGSRAIRARGRGRTTSMGQGQDPGRNFMPPFAGSSRLPEAPEMQEHNFSTLEQFQDGSLYPNQHHLQPPPSQYHTSGPPIQPPTTQHNSEPQPPTSLQYNSGRAHPGLGHLLEQQQQGHLSVDHSPSAITAAPGLHNENSCRRNLIMSSACPPSLKRKSHPSSTLSISCSYLSVHSSQDLLSKSLLEKLDTKTVFGISNNLQDLQKTKRNIPRSKLLSTQPNYGLLFRQNHPRNQYNLSRSCNYPH